VTLIVAERRFVTGPERCYAPAMGNIGAPEIILLLLVALLLFGAKRLPEIGRSLGTGMREFKDSVTGVKHEVTEATQLPAATHDTTSAHTQARENEPVG
jgi:sec-independent protein translocase protein TatA